MDRNKIINAIATKDVELLKAAVGRSDNRTVMIGSDGCYLGTERRANKSDLNGKSIIQFVKCGGE